jgi:hypothetical protein
MIEKIQSTVGILAIFMVIVIWVENAWNGKSKQPPHWFMVVILGILTISVVGYFAIALYGIWV